MRQLEESNAGMYMQAEHLLAAAAAEERTRAKAASITAGALGRGLHSSTAQLNLSRV